MPHIDDDRVGWKVGLGTTARAIGLAAAILSLTLAGCSAKKPSGAAGAGLGSNTGGLGQQGLGAGSDGSLSQFQRGALGSGEQGPLGDVHFDYNDYTVRPQDGRTLQSDADWLQKNPGRRVQIEGHCDERGSEEYNLALGAKRAEATKQYLQTLGVAGDRMSTMSYGKELPLCSGHAEDCWIKNRRGHFAVTE